MTVECTNVTRPRPPTIPSSATRRAIVQSDPMIRVNPCSIRGYESAQTHSLRPCLTPRVGSRLNPRRTKIRVHSHESLRLPPCQGRHATRCEPIQRFSIALRDLRASGRRGKVLAAGLEGGEEDRKRGLRIGTSAGEDIESDISVLGVSVERDVRLREEEVAREATPFEPVQHRRADRLHPTPTRRLVETIGQQPGIDQTVGGDVVKVGEQVLTDH